jgi:hypothetical protein
MVIVSQHILTTTKMHNLNGWILWYMNYSSIKLFSEIKFKKTKTRVRKLEKVREDKNI